MNIRVMAHGPNGSSPIHSFLPPRQAPVLHSWLIQPRTRPSSSPIWSRVSNQLSTSLQYLYVAYVIDPVQASISSVLVLTTKENQGLQI